MGETTGISWSDATWSPWIGCAKVSPGCKFCYAEGLDARFGKGEHWGVNAPRRFMSESYWKQPIAWNRKAEREGTRIKVFPSQCDVFEDRPDLATVRHRLFALIRATPNLDWLLLTKRPEMLAELLPAATTINVWLGVSVEDHEHAELRIPILMETSAAKRFVSYEPALGPVGWRQFLSGEKPRPDWIIYGDESGRSRRSADLDWARATRDACAEFGVPFHLKQLHPSQPQHAIAIGGSPDRAGKIHLPILDGHQHAEFPR